jgi:hypothetical protein
MRVSAVTAACEARDVPRIPAVMSDVIFVFMGVFVFMGFESSYFLFLISYWPHRGYRSSAIIHPPSPLRGNSCCRRGHQRGITLY